MTVKQMIDERARAFAREVITEEFKQPAPDELVKSVARKVSRAMPLRTLAKMNAQYSQELESAK